MDDATTPFAANEINVGSGGPRSLFIYNEHLATEALLGGGVPECGFDVDTFNCVPAERNRRPGRRT